MFLDQHPAWFSYPYNIVWIANPELSIDPASWMDGNWALDTHLKEAGSFTGGLEFKAPFGVGKESCNVDTALTSAAEE